jgi:hypothetical protein
LPGECLGGDLRPLRLGEVSRLVHVALVSIVGTAYYNPLTLGATDFDNLHVRAGRLGDAEILYDDPETDFSPSNLWAEDRSWCLCTDYDLWATKVAGPPALIEALLSDFEIEAVRLPWSP